MIEEIKTVYILMCAINFIIIKVAQTEWNVSIAVAPDIKQENAETKKLLVPIQETDQTQEVEIMAEEEEEEALHQVAQEAVTKENVFIYNVSP